MDRDVLWVSAWYAVCVAWLAALIGWLEPVPYWGLWVLAGYALADVGSYLFHYIIDHYGDPSRPGLVRDFQFHHLEPWGIARKRVSQAIAPAARIVTPVALLWLLAALAGWLPGWLALTGFELAALWVFTQVFHRWAHMPTRGLVRLAQRARLIVGSRAHRLHHRAPFASHFAVINGWSNRPLDALGAPALLDRLLGMLGWRKRGLESSLKVLVEQIDTEAGTYAARTGSF